MQEDNDPNNFALQIVKRALMSLSIHMDEPIYRQVGLYVFKLSLLKLYIYIYC
jgi:hypothetical protein